MLQSAPYNIPLVRSGINASREKQSLLSKVPHRGQGRPGTVEGFKQHAQGLLDLLVRIENEMTFGVIDESNGWPHDQFAALGFVQDATLQSSPQNVQLGFAPGSLQPEQQAIIEVRGIIDAIFVQDEGVGKGAYFQQTMP